MRHYNLMALIAMFLCGSSFAHDVYFSCDTVKGNIKLDEDRGVLHYSLIKDGKKNLTMSQKVMIFRDLNTIITHDFKLITSMCHS